MSFQQQSKLVSCTSKMDFSLHINMALIGQAISEEKIFEYYGNIHVRVYCPGLGADEPLGSFFSESLMFQSYSPFPARFSL